MVRFLSVFQAENPDLYYAVPWSYGTLGFLVSAEIKIIPSKKYIKMEYYPVHSKEEMAAKFTEQTLLKGDNEFVETLAYSLDTAVVMTGNFTDDAEADKVREGFLCRELLCPPPSKGGHIALLLFVGLSVGRSTSSFCSFSLHWLLILI
jgi:hypothetical protein